MLFSQSLALKLAKQNVTSVSLHPGIIYTNLSRNVEWEEFSGLGKYVPFSSFAMETLRVATSIDAKQQARSTDFKVTRLPGKPR